MGLLSRTKGAMSKLKIITKFKPSPPKPSVLVRPLGAILSIIGVIFATYYIYITLDTFTFEESPPSAFGLIYTLVMQVWSLIINGIFLQVFLTFSDGDHQFNKFIFINLVLRGISFLYHLWIIYSEEGKHKYDPYPADMMLLTLLDMLFILIPAIFIAILLARTKLTSYKYA